MSNGFLTMAASRAEDSHASASTQEKRYPIAPPAGDVRLGSVADIRRQIRDVRSKADIFQGGFHVS